jgi:hypothetical protein
LPQKSIKLTQKFNDKLFETDNDLSLTESCGEVRPAKPIHHALEITKQSNHQTTMKPIFRNPFAAAIFAAATLTASSYAQTTLLTDDFNSETSFTANPNADQTGTLAGASYTVASLFGLNTSVRGAGVLEISPDKEAGDRVIVNADYITYANTNDTAIRFSFTYDASSADWVGFSVGTDSAWMSSSGELNVLFTNSGTSAAWKNGVAQTAPTTFSYPQTITVELRGIAGGSAFNGGGSVAEIWAGSTSIATYTLEQLNATNGKFAFNSYNGSSGAGGTVDNFSITAASSYPQTTLLADDFTVTGTPDTNDINFNLAPRQGGTQATQTWTGSGNAQMGNPSIFGGSGDYLMVADQSSYAHLAGFTLSSALVPANQKLVIKFDADTEISFGDPSNWLSFMISPSSGGGLFHPIVGSGDFGMLITGGGGVAMFNNGTGVGGGSLASSGINTITLTFSGADGTGSPFAGLGTRVNLSDGTNSWNTTLDTGLTSETISFGTYGAGTRGYVDNLSIYTIPEPSEPSDPLLAWIDATWPSLFDKTPGGDPDNDGIANLVEYVLQGGDPSVSTTNILPTLDASGADFVFTYYRRTAATGTTQTFEYGDNLSGWTPVLIPGGAGVVVTSPSAGIEKVEITVAKGANTKLFGRLQVVK